MAKQSAWKIESAFLKLLNHFQRIGLKNVILETDAPYLAPVPFRGKRNEPAYTMLVAEKLVEITGLSAEAIEELTTANALKLFKLQ